MYATEKLNTIIEETAKEEGIDINKGPIITSDVFDCYVNFDKFIKHFQKDDYYAAEMETFALFHLAKKLNKQAACLLTVVDSKYCEEKEISAVDRQNKLFKMLELALNSAIKD